MSVTSEILEKIKKQDPHEFEFHQAAEEVLGLTRPAPSQVVGDLQQSLQLRRQGRLNRKRS